MPRPTLLPEATLAHFLSANPSWQVVDGALSRTFELPSFPAAIAFVVSVGFAAEKLDHHPDLDVRYKKVRLSVSTHDAGGLTELDTTLATRADAIFGR